MEAEDSNVIYVGDGEGQEGAGHEEVELDQNDEVEVDQNNEEDGHVQEEAQECEGNEDDNEPVLELGDDEYVVRDEEDANEILPNEDEQRITDEKSAGKEDTIVVDEWDNDDVASISDEEDHAKTEDGKDIIDPEESEKAMLKMPSLKTIMGDLIHLRRNRRLSIHPVTIADLSSSVIQNILNSDVCEEAKMQFIRPSEDSKSWTGFLSLTFVTSKCASHAIDSVKSLREDISVKLDPNPDTSLDNFVKEQRKGGGAWPSHWADKLVLVRNIPADTKPEDLRTLFADAEEIIVAKVSPSSWAWSTKHHEPSAKAMGFAYVLYENAEAARAVAAVMADGVEFKDKLIGVHLYREPVSTIPRTLLYLRRRRVVIRYMEKLLSKLERSKMDPEYKLAPTVESRLEACRSLIEKDDQVRNELNMPTPTYEDFRNMRGFKPISAAETERILNILNVIPKPVKVAVKKVKKAGTNDNVQQDRDKSKAFTKKNEKSAKPRGGGIGGGRGRGVVARGAGNIGGRGRGVVARGAGNIGANRNFRRSPPKNTRLPQYRNDWGSNNRRGFSGHGRDGSRGVNQAGGSGLGMFNPLTALMMQQNMGLMGTGGVLNPLVMGSGGMGMGGLSNQQMPMLGGAGGSLEPPPKLMRLDESGSYRSDREYDRDRHVMDRLDDRGHFHDRGRPRSRSPPDYRTQRAGMNFPSSSRYNEPDRAAQYYGEGSHGGHGGLGPARNDDINLLMNLSKMLSQKMEQKRQQSFDRF